MAEFSKLFPFIEKLFPPMGRGAPSPRIIGDDVSFTHELYKPDLKHVFYLTTTNDSFGGAGATGKIILVPEPAPGYVTLAISASVFQTGNAGGVTVQFEMEETGNAIDIETGVWGALSGFGHTINLLTPDRWVGVDVRIPIPRGNRLMGQFITPAAGTLRTRSYAIQVPIETVAWWGSVGSAGTFVQTQAI